MSSCGGKTYEKIIVKAPKESTLYIPGEKGSNLGQVPNSGTLSVAIPSDMYCGYLLVTDPDSKQNVPLGLDYVKNTHRGTKALSTTGTTIMSIGTIGVATGTIMLLAAGDDMTTTSAAIIGGGAGVVGIGAGIGAKSMNKMSQTAYEYNFGYVKNQDMSIPKLSSTLLKPNSTKEQTNRKLQKKKASSGQEIVSQQVSSSSNVNRARADISNKIAGTYSGHGSLIKGNNVEEQYSQISVIVERIDKNHVGVRIIENDTDYFESPLTYTVKTGQNEGYELSMDNLPGTIITITSNGDLIFNHNNVNIDNTLYRLKIKASKK